MAGVAISVIVGIVMNIRAAVEYVVLLSFNLISK